METKKRIRRTPDEIKAGLTITQKKAGLTIEDLQKEQSEHQEKQKVKYIYKTKIEEKEVEVPVIKEVRILRGTDKTEKTVDQIIKEEFHKCTWEWKELPLSKCKLTELKKLGKQGWKMTHIMEWKLLKDTWKNREDTVFFQRPRG